MLKLDNRIDIARRRQFAGEIAKLDPSLLRHLRDHVDGGETEEFYAGVLAGLVAATTLIQSDLAEIIPQATAVIADLCESREYAA